MNMEIEIWRFGVLILRFRQNETTKTISDINMGLYIKKKKI